MATRAESEQAVESLTATLNGNPNDVASWASLGAALLNLKQPHEAIRRLTHAVDLNPQSDVLASSLLSTLASAHLQAGDADAAMNWFEKAHALAPDNLNALRELASLKEKRHDLDGAAHTADLLLAESPGDALALVIKARAVRRGGQADIALDILDSTKPEDRDAGALAAYWVERGRCLDALERYDDAIKSFQTGQDINRQAHPEVQAHKANGATIIAREHQALTQLKTKTADAPAAPHFGASPVFLIGFPRSGTTLLDSILESHPGVTVLSERSPIEPIHSDLMRTGADQDLNALASYETAEKLRTRYWTLIEERMNGRPPGVLVDKLPLNLLFVRTIHALFPNAKFVMALRHPCDVCLSNYTQPFSLNLFMANFLNLDDTANFYTACMQHWMLARETLPLNVHDVRYEDVVENFAPTIAALLEFIGLPWDDAVNAYHQHALQRTIITPSYEQVVKPIYQSARNRWHNYRSAMEPVLPTLMPLITALDYSIPTGEP